MNRDTFAVAMYLIRQKIAGKDLPQTLPASLVPPSMRQAIPAQPAQPPVLQEPQPSSAAQDLFGLDAAFGLTTQPTGSPAPAFRAQSGLQSPARTTSPIQITSSPKPASPVVSTTPLSRTFQPTSDFGRTIATPILDRSKPVTFSPAVQASPSGFSQLNPPAPPQIAMQSGSVFGDQDLLGDADPEISQQLTAETAELANLSNQIGSLNNATRDLQSNKAKAETELATVSQQKRDIEARLKQIRALYDAEVNNVKAVESQLTTVRAELGKNRQEFTVLEASFHALQAQVEDQKSTLQKDQTENAALRTKIASVGEEIKQLKETLEKLKRDARQQRGMVAINKKQLSTSEGERDKIQGEIDSEKQAIEALKAEAAAVAAAAAAAAAAPPAMARDVTSPALSERSQGTNPFLRMQSTGDASAAFSPPAPFSPPATQTWSDFPEEAFSNAFPQPTSSPAPAPAAFAPSIEKIEHPSLQQVRDASVEQTAPPSIASALSPPLDAREFSAPVESETSSLAVNPPGSAVGSVNGDAPSQPVSESKSPKEDEIEAVGPVAESGAPPVHPLSSDEIVISDVQEQEVKESFTDAEPTPPVQAETIEAPVPTSDVLSSHGPRSAEGVTSPDIVQETLSHPPRDEDLTIPSSEHEITEATEATEPETKQQEKEEEENKGASLPGGFPSEGSDEGRESWVDLGDESKSLPSEQSAAPLPSNRSDPFAFETSSAPPRAATKEDFDAAFSSFGNFGKKEENGAFKKDFDTEFPPIEEFDNPESDSDDEPDGFNDNFAEKGKEIADTNGTSKVAETGQQVETPLQQTLPIAPTLQTLAKPASTLGSPDATAPLTDVPPPLPPKDKLLLPPQLESMATGERTPAERELKPPAYTEYGNIADTSSGSNDLSGLLPTRGEPHARPAPYTSPPPRAEFSTPTPFQPAQPVSFSPPPPPPPVAVTAPTYATVPTASALTSQAVAEPSAPASFGNFGSFPTTSQPIPTKPVQTFDAFDFSGLQEAAPLDEEVPEDSFRESQGFGEFDTTFDSAPVTPAKSSTQQPSAPQPTNDFSNFSWDAPPDFGTSQAQHAQQPTSFSSNFDDVFASFDRPTTITPPTLPPRDAAAQDDPNLKTLTGTVLAILD